MKFERKKYRTCHAYTNSVGRRTENLITRFVSENKLVSKIMFAGFQRVRSAINTLPKDVWFFETLVASARPT